MADGRRGLTLTRYSSRLDGLDGFIRSRLKGAASYDRIAGYFRSSIFEVVGEEIATVGRVRIVCNSDLDPGDIRASQAARSQALMQRWWEDVEREGVSVDTLFNRRRYRLLRDALSSRNAAGQPKGEIRVVDRLTAPLLHGKAGIITAADGAKTCLMGSMNETRRPCASTTSSFGRIVTAPRSRGRKPSSSTCGGKASTCRTR